MLPTERFDDRAAVVNGVVAIPRAATCNGDDGPVIVAHENLHVARPAIVLGFGCSAVITRRHQCAVDDPRSSKIAALGLLEDRCQARYEVGDDALYLRLRDRDDRGELAHGQVGPKAHARHDDSLLQRRGPRPATRAPALAARSELFDYVLKLGPREASERRATRAHPRERAITVRGRSYDRLVASRSAGKRTRGPNKETPWARTPEDGLSVLRLALDTSDPLQRRRLEDMFSAAFSVRRAVQGDARDRSRAYRAAHRARDRDPAAAR